MQVWLDCFETGSLYLALPVLEGTRMALNTEIYCLCLLGGGIKGLCHRAWLSSSL